MKKAWSHYSLYLLTALCVFWPASSYALISLPGLSCYGQNIVGSVLYSGVSCNYDQTQFFSLFICQFEHIINEIIGRAYCQVSAEFSIAFKGILSLAVVFLGIGFLIGTTPFTAKELTVFLFKVAFIYNFAVNWDLAIGYGYYGFITAAKEGITIVLTGVSGNPYSSGGDGFAYIDSLFQNILHGDDSQKGAEGDPFEENPCRYTVLALFGVLMVGVPPLFLVAIFMLVKLVWVVVRACFGFCMAMMGISFLIVLSPLFLSFAFFKPTQRLFDKYISILISYTLQLTIVFAFLAMVISMEVYQYLTGFLDLVRPVSDIPATGGYFIDITQCGLCEFTVSGGGGASLGVPACVDGGEVYSFTNIMQNPAILGDATLEIMKISLLAYVLDSTMSMVPELAKHLTNEKLAASLGGGPHEEARYGVTPNINMPGEGLMRNVGSAFAAGFRDGGAGTPGKALEGVGDAISTALVGRRDGNGNYVRGNDGQPIERGLLGNTFHFFGSMGSR